MKTILHLLQARARAAIKLACAEELSVDLELLEPEIVHVADPKFGHYQCNNALKLGKALKKNPREVAQKIISFFELNQNSGQPFIQKIEIAGPGFINLTLDARFLSQEINALLKDPRCGIEMPAHPERVIVEFSSPNVAKELHVGHLRSTVIGDCLARIFEFLGYDVLRLNHVGDWGTQFGMLIAYMQETVPEVFSGQKEADLPTLMRWYKDSRKRFDEDLEFKKRAQLQVVKLQAGDTASLKAWEMICDISRKGYQEIYDLLDVDIIERGESFYNPYLAPLIKDLEHKGIITVSEGAKCIFLEGFQNREGEALPMIVQKSDGGYNYDTTDMAALRQRVDVEKASRIIYVVDAGQSLHFQMVFKAAEKAGYFDPKKVQVDHVPFGVVLGSDGKKFKTRSGETERLIDLLNEAIKRAKDILQEKTPDLSENDLERMAKILGIDAIKYADLSCNRISDYVFSYERMLKFEGNTAAFMLYAYVRTEGIKRKVHKNIQEVLSRALVDVVHPSEVALALHLCRFGEALDAIVRDLLPNRLTEYLYECAEKFNAFFRDCRVEGVPEEESRLLLCEATARILKNGLSLLGLKVLEKM